jgi:hypothetical protein
MTSRRWYLAGTSPVPLRYVAGTLWAMFAAAFATVMWALGAVVIFVVVWKVGIGMTRSLTMQLPAPPPDGEMRRVSVKYRCSNCGLELRMTLAPEEDPFPPRHCMEDMDLVAPID